MSNSISFTAAGIDVGSIVQGFVAVDRQPIDRLTTRQSAVKLQSDTVARLRTSVDGLRATAANLLSNGVARNFSSVSSNAVTASMSPSAVPGSISFTVDQLARAHGMRTSSGVASSTSVITNDAALALSTSTTKLGLGAAAVGAGVTAGKYTVTVTQATVGAVKSASGPLAGSTTITTGLNDTIDVEIDGVARSLTLAAGIYNASALSAAVQSAATTAGAGLTSSLDGTGRLRLTTTHEGSAATIRVTGGSALGALGLSTDVAAITGTDGAVKIGENAVTTVTSAGAGAGPIAVTTGSGNLTFDVSGGLRTGSATVAVVSTGDRTLASVAAAINGANVGATASAVKVSDGNWLLQLNSRTTGTDGTLALKSSSFAGVGGLIDTSTPQNARITIGSGPGQYSVTSSTNVFSEVMPGVSLTANAESATPVTVSVARNDAATADVVSNLVSSVNKVISEIALQTKFDTKTNRASPLSGDAGIRRLADEVRGAVTALIGDASTGLASAIGIDAQRDGTLKFDSARFTAALQNDPAAVERLFARGGSSTASLQFGGAVDRTEAGSYAVEVTTPATRATTGDILLGGSPGGQRIAVRVGTVTATYDAAPGATAADIVSGLNAALSEAGLKINAEESGGGVRLTAVSFGAAASFETNLDVLGAGSWGTNNGTDVAGTINGVTATGVGNRLKLLELDTNAARGLEVTVGEGVSGSIGSVTYSPGVAARLTNLATRAMGEGGTLTSSAKTYDARFEAFEEQITRYEDRLAIKEASYRRQWTQVQSLLQAMQTQQNWLTSQIQGLTGNRDG